MALIREQKLESPTSAEFIELGIGAQETETNGTATITFEKALSVVNDLVFGVEGRYLSKVEILVMKGIWDNLDYEEISANSDYSSNYIQRTIAPKLWKILTKTIGAGQRIGKIRMRCYLEQFTKKYYAESKDITEAANYTGSASIEKQTPSCWKQRLEEEKQLVQPEQEENFRSSANNFAQPINTELLTQKQFFSPQKLVLGDLPPNTVDFFGRKKELVYLLNLINKLRCVALTGIPGIGKTALGAKLLAEISIQSQPTFDCLIWKSVAHAPLLEELVSQLINLISTPSTESIEEYTQAKISVLLKQMQTRRTLIVLDGYDVCNPSFQKHNLEQHLQYEIFFRRLVEERHQSCVIVTTRVLPRALEELSDTKRSIAHLKLEGLDLNAARQLLFSHGLTNKEKCNELTQTYRGCPSELKAVATKIYRFFGTTEKFFENKTTLISAHLQESLNQKFGQLNELQRQVMIFLAEEIDSKSKFINSNFIGFDQILNHLRQTIPVSVSTLLTALEELEKDSLIEINRHPTTKEISFTLQPGTKKYILTDPMKLVRRSA